MFISSAFFLDSSLLATGCCPKLSEMTGPGLALWSSIVALPASSVLWCGCEEAVESLDSLATWSVKSGQDQSLALQTLRKAGRAMVGILPLVSSSLGWTGMVTDALALPLCRAETASRVLRSYSVSSLFAAGDDFGLCFASSMSFSKSGFCAR